jgi:hypothetical protein
VSRHRVTSASRPLFSSKRTFISELCTSAKCHKQTFTGASTHLAASLLGGFQGKVSCAVALGHQKSTIVLSVRCSRHLQRVGDQSRSLRQATKPNNGGCDLLRPTKSPNRLLFEDVFRDRIQRRSARPWLPPQPRRRHCNGRRSPGWRRPVHLLRSEPSSWTSASVTAAPASAKALAVARRCPVYLMSSMITFTDPGNIQTLPRRNRVRRLRPAPFYATSVVR